MSRGIMGPVRNHMNFSLSDIRIKNGIQAAAAVLMIVWPVLFAAFFAFAVGWRNLSDLLPHEIAAVLMAFLMPVFLFAVLFAVSGMSADAETVAERIRLHGEAMRVLSEKIDRIPRPAEKDDRWLVEALDAQKAATRDIAGAIAAIGGQRVLIADIDGKLADLLRREQARAEDAKAEKAKAEAEKIKAEAEQARTRAEKARAEDAAKAEADKSRNIAEQAALMGLINLVMNDVSISVTRVLVRLMETEQRSKEEIQDAIQGLVGAFSAGDKDVFFRLLHQRLVARPEWIESLRSQAAQSPALSRDLAKIVNGGREIASLVGRCNDGDIIADVFGETALKALGETLESHIEAGGSAAA